MYDAVLLTDRRTVTYLAFFGLLDIVAFHSRIELGFLVQLLALLTPSPIYPARPC